MKKLLAFIGVLITSYSAIAEDRKYGYTFNLGHGFIKRDYTVKNPPNHFEAIAHYSATFFKKRDLGQLDGFSISPSGRYAIYIKSEEGRLYMFNIPKQAEYRIKFDDYCYPYSPTWNEGKNILEIRCYGKGNTNFKLQIDLIRWLARNRQ
jgi:hypothetical protein